MTYDRSGLDQVGGVTQGAKAGVESAEGSNTDARNMHRAAMDTEGLNVGPSSNTERYMYTTGAAAGGKNAMFDAQYMNSTAEGEKSLVQGENDSTTLQKAGASGSDELISAVNATPTA